MATINLATYRDFTGATFSPASPQLQTLPTCALPFTVANILVDTLTGLEVTTLGPGVTGAVKITDNCTNTFTIVEGSKDAIEQYINNACCITYIASATIINTVNNQGEVICDVNGFNYPFLADLTPYGGANNVPINNDQDLIDALFALTAVKIFISGCKFYFPSDYTGVISNIEYVYITPPQTQISLAGFEVNIIDTHGELDNVPCATWATQTIEYSIDGTTWTAPATVTAGTIALCGLDLSALSGTASYNGTLHVRRIVTDCGGTDTDILTANIVTDSASTIGAVGGNYCVIPFARPLTTNLEVGATGLVVGNYEATYSDQGAPELPIGTDECMRMEIRKNGVVIASMQGSTQTELAMWTNTLGAPNGYFGAGQFYSGYDFNKTKFVQDTAIGAGELTFHFWVGGTCPSVANPTIFVESTNVDNEQIICNTQSAILDNQGNGLQVTAGTIGGSGLTQLTANNFHLPFVSEPNPNGEILGSVVELPEWASVGSSGNFDVRHTADHQITLKAITMSNATVFTGNVILTNGGSNTWNMPTELLPAVQSMLMANGVTLYAEFTAGGTAVPGAQHLSWAILRVPYCGNTPPPMPVQLELEILRISDNATGKILINVNPSAWYSV